MHTVPRAARIRLARDADAPALAAIYAPIVEATAISFEVVPPDASEMARRVAETLCARPWLVCEIGGRLAGYAYASAHAERAAYRWSANVSVYVDAAHHRCGVGRGLYRSLFAILRAQGYVNAYGGITLPNPASVALHEALGFRSVGVYHRVGHKLGSWHDVGWWELALMEHEQSPRLPTDLAAVRRRDDWGALLASGESSIRPAAA